MMKITFAQALDHLKVGDILGDGKIIRIDTESFDVEVELPGALVINHYRADHEGLFEFDDTAASPELKRRASVTALSSEERFDALMDEIELLKARVFLLEKNNAL